TVFEFAEEGSTPYIVMEFLRGTSLAARMASPLPLALEAKLDVIAQLCDALNYAHEQGVVHRDVKPANVFLLTDGTVKLLDFGIAKVTTSTLTRQGDVLGSASYMSPEQVAGSDSVDGRADIFSIGVVLYELLAGRKPFHAEAPTAIIMKILHEDPPPIESFVPGLPPQLIAAVNKALAKKPEDRFQTAGELSKQLQWIRKALVAAAEGGAALEETRFATPTEIKKFQELLDANRPADLSDVSAAKSAGASAKPKWLVPAAVGGAVAVVAIGALLVSRPSSDKAAPAGAPAAATAATKAPATPEKPAPAADGVSVKIETDPTGA